MNQGYFSTPQRSGGGGHSIIVSPKKEDDNLFFSSLFAIEQHTSNLPKGVRVGVEVWIKKLLECNSKKTRAQYAGLLKHFIVNKRGLKPPFDKKPPSGELQPLSGFMNTFLQGIGDVEQNENNGNNKNSLFLFNPNKASSIKKNQEVNMSDFPSPIQISKANYEAKDNYQDILQSLEEKYLLALENLSIISAEHENLQQIDLQKNEEIDTLKSERKILEQEIFSLQQKCIEYQKRESISLQTHAGNLIKMTQAHQNEIKKIKEEYELKEASFFPASLRESLEKTLEQQKKRIQIVETQLKEKENAWTYSDSSDPTKKLLFQNQEDLIAVLENQLKETKLQTQIHNQQLNSLQLSNHKQCAQLEKFRIEMEQLRKLEEHNLHLQQQNKQQAIDIEDLCKKMDEMELEQKDNISRLKHEHSTFLENELDKLKQPLDELQKNLLEKENSLKVTEEKLSQTIMDNQKLAKLLSQQNEILENMKVEVNYSNSKKYQQFQEIKQIRQENQDQFTQLQEKLSTVSLENEQLIKQITQEKEWAVQKLHSEISRLQIEHTKKVDSVKNNLEETVRALQAKIRLLETHQTDQNVLRKQEITHLEEIHKIEVSNLKEQYEQHINILTQNFEDRLQRAHSLISKIQSHTPITPNTIQHTPPKSRISPTQHNSNHNITNNNNNNNSHSHTYFRHSSSENPT